MNFSQKVSLHKYCPLIPNAIIIKPSHIKAYQLSGRMWVVGHFYLRTQAHQEPGYKAMPFHRQWYKATHTGYTQLSALPAQVGITKTTTKQTTVSILLLWRRKADYNFLLTVHTCPAEIIHACVCNIPQSENHEHSAIHTCKWIRWHHRKPYFENI